MANLLNLLGLGATAAVNAKNAQMEGRAAAERQGLLDRIAQEERDMQRRLQEAQIANYESQAKARNTPPQPEPIYDRDRGGFVNPADSTFTPIQGLPSLPEKVNTAATRIDPLSPEGIAAAEERARRLGSVAPPRAQLPTEGERKAAAFYASGKQGYDTLEQLLSTGQEVPSLGAQMASRIGLGVGNVMTNQQLRQMQQAALMLSDAWLRYTSGAAVPEQEVERFAQSFIPRAGDDPATLEQKKQARAVIIEALRKGAGRALDPSAVGMQPNIVERYQLEVPE